MATLWKCKYVYQTSSPVANCIEKICCTPCSFRVNLFLEYYDYKICSDSQIAIIFKGRPLGGLRRTEYLFTFEEAPTGTMITAVFQRELFGFFPIPFVSTYHLDAFMNQKINGYRIP